MSTFLLHGRHNDYFKGSLHEDLIDQTNDANSAGAEDGNEEAVLVLVLVLVQFSGGRHVHDVQSTSLAFGA